MLRSELTDKIMPFGEHLEELRRRLVFALGGVVPIFVISLAFGRTLLNILLAPAWEALDRADLPVEMQQTGPMEVFFAYLKVSLVMTIIIGSPWIIFQLWRFISPGLYSKERRYVHILAPLSACLAAVGCLFLYYVLLPITLMFFVQFGMSITKRDSAPPVSLPPGIALPSVPILDADPLDPVPGQMWINRELKQLRFAIPLDAPAADIETPAEAAGDPPGSAITDAPVEPGALKALATSRGPIMILGTPLVKDALIRQQYRVSEVLSLVLSFALGIAAAFQVPVLVVLLGWLGLISPAVLGKYRRHALFICVILGAIITPTGDPLTLTLMTLPLILLYELGGILLRLMPPAPPIHEDTPDDNNDDNNHTPEPSPSPPPPPSPTEGDLDPFESRPIIAPPREGATSIVPRESVWHEHSRSEVGEEEPESEGDAPQRYADDHPAPPEDPDDAGPNPRA